VPRPYDAGVEYRAMETDMDVTCAHHWILGQPNAGTIEARCKRCGALRVYPAVLDDLDPGIEPEARLLSGVATAVGGARPSSVAALPGDSGS
jgi:hypothetical protein